MLVTASQCYVLLLLGILYHLKLKISLGCALRNSAGIFYYSNFLIVKTNGLIAALVFFSICQFVNSIPKVFFPSNAQQQYKR